MGMNLSQSLFFDGKVWAYLGLYLPYIVGKKFLFPI